MKDNWRIEYIPELPGTNIEEAIKTYETAKYILTLIVLCAFLYFLAKAINEFKNGNYFMAFKHTVSMILSAIAPFIAKGVIV